MTLAETHRPALIARLRSLTGKRLDYEPDIRIGDFQDKPKVQKYHTEKEFRELFGPLFRSVKVDDLSNNINAACASARPVDPARLRAAIEFEFDLPYPDGSRMDLVKCAMDSFGQRLQIGSLRFEAKDCQFPQNRGCPPEGSGRGCACNQNRELVRP